MDTRGFQMKALPNTSFVGLLTFYVGFFWRCATETPVAMTTGAGVLSGAACMQEDNATVCPMRLLCSLAHGHGIKQQLGLKRSLSAVNWLHPYMFLLSGLFP